MMMMIIKLKIIHPVDRVKAANCDCDAIGSICVPTAEDAASATNIELMLDLIQLY